MGGFSDGVANAMLDALARNVAYAEAGVWAQLHTGDPGSAGTNNPATETDRDQVLFSSPASSRTIANTSAVVWVSVAASETYSWISLWDASTSGNHLGNSELPAPAPVLAGDTFRIPAGDVVMTIP